jgi:uncharacterized HAD superfamily protein
MSALITLIVMTPVLYWNMKNNFISFTFNGNRADIFHSHIDLKTFVQFNLGEFFYQNPVLFVVFILALFSAFGKMRDKNKEMNRLLAYLSLPLILFFTLLSVFRNTLPHWTGPVFICMIILSSGWLSDIFEKRKKVVSYTILAANVLFILVVTVGTIQIRNGSILPADSNSDPTKVGRNDFTLDMFGWDQAGKKFSQFLSKENITSVDSDKVKIISNKWFPAAHLDFYLAHPLKLDLIVPAGLEAAHKYYWINKSRHINEDDRVFFITTSQQYFAPDGFKSLFREIIPKDTLHIVRNGHLVKNLFIYEMAGFKADSAHFYYRNESL